MPTYGAASATAAVCAIACLAALAACTSQPRRDVPLGHACYRSFSYDESPRQYLCLFELSSPSTFYDDEAVRKALASFVESEGGDCEVSPERELADVETIRIDHGLKYRYFSVACR